MLGDYFVSIMHKFSIHNNICLNLNGHIYFLLLYTKAGINLNVSHFFLGTHHFG
jgi:hypothetical protein